MKIINCPLNGQRNAQEFVYGGEVEPHPNPHLVSDDEWASYVFIEKNLSGKVLEWWCHVPTAYWFIAERDTKLDEIFKTYDPSKIFKERIDFLPPEDSSKKTTESAVNNLHNTDNIKKNTTEGNS
ncbi:MAG: sarcosine oxidase subunit delta [Alphaproteobacteria bacterium]|nr:sarcosine oxidase subunit delta [Alphaproteobacteria bacterium]|tara:strand:+ start:85 stop:459 length:375 start_codon:yes stop_codon:yes gene_type:complete